MQPITRLKLAIAREAIEFLLLVYAAAILYLGFVNGPRALPVLVAALCVTLVALLLLSHVVTTIAGYALLTDKIKRATHG